MNLASLRGVPARPDDGKADTPGGFLHPRDARCPFVAADYPWEVERGTCCTLDVSSLRAALLRLSEPTLAECVVRAVDLAGTAALVRDLEYAADTVYGFGDDGNAAALKDADEVSVAASWYEALASRGYGVRVERGESTEVVSA